MSCLYSWFLLYLFILCPPPAMHLPFIFMRVNIFIFYFMASRFCVILRMIQNYRLFFYPSSSFTVLFFLFKALIHLELILVSRSEVSIQTFPQNVCLAVPRLYIYYIF